MSIEIADMDPDIYTNKRARLLKLGAILEIPVVVGDIAIEEYDPGGWIEQDGLLIPPAEPEILQHHTQPMGSWNRNQINMMISQLCGLNYRAGPGGWVNGIVCLKDLGGDLRASATNSMGARLSGPLDSPITDDTHGLLVGTGAGATDFDGHVLGAQIPHGSAGGQLYHFAFTVIKQVWNGGTRTWDITMSRIFRNYSGGSITINETGLYAHYHYTSSQNTIFMVARDKVSSGIAIADNNVAKVLYTFTTAAWPS